MNFRPPWPGQRPIAPRAASTTLPEKQRTRAQKDRDWETVVKMTMIARDLMIGNPRLAELDWGEEALGHNAILGGFQGQRQWTDHFPNGDFMEAMLNSFFRLERHPCTIRLCHRE